MRLLEPNEKEPMTNNCDNLPPPCAIQASVPYLKVYVFATVAAG